MAPHGPSEIADSLHADDRWLRDLARRMLRDTSLADDAAQATWVSVLRSPPKEGMTRGFLATALRNVIAKLRRGDSRRQARERVVAATEAVDLGGVIEKMELRRVLLAAVLELDPIYRDVVLLRFHQDLPPSAIAERTGLPVATVKTRLRRAEELLAERLDRRANGDRRKYLGALVATAEPTLRGAITTLLLGGFVMTAKNKLVGAVVALLVVVGGFVLFEGGGDLATTKHEAAATASPRFEATPPQLDDRSSAVVTPDRVSAEVAKPSSEDAKSSGTLDDTRTVVGYVFDASGVALGHAEVAFEVGPQPGFGKPPVVGPRPTAIADAGGKFELTIPKDLDGRIVGAASRIATVYSGVVRKIDSPVAPVVVLAPGIGFGGEVVDIDGRPIEGAEVAIGYVPTLQARYPMPLENSRNELFREETTADGRFAFDRLLPVFDGARLSAHAPGYLSYGSEVPATDDIGARIVLERPAPKDENRIRGQVVDPLGLPVPKADVILGFAAGITDERGLFDLDIRRAETAKVIRAVAPGFQPGTVDWPIAPELEFVVIKLGPPAKSIRGFLKNADGGVVSRANVQPFDGTPLGFVADSGLLMYAEARIGGYDHGVDTDAYGAFELGGLEDRSYSLRVFLPLSGASFITQPIAAGSVNITIELPTDLTIPELRGRIVDRAGKPVAGIDVSIDATRWFCSYLGAGYAATSGAIGTTKSDAEGRFTLVAVPRTYAEIDVDGSSIVARSLKIPADPSAEMEIVVDRKRFLRIEVPAGENATQFAVEDDKGTRLHMRQEEEGGVVMSATMTITAGKSPVTIVPETAKFVVLSGPEGEIRRIPIVFEADEVTVVR